MHILGRWEQRRADRVGGLHALAHLLAEHSIAIPNQADGQFARPWATSFIQTGLKADGEN
jgi:hypothetical protein